MHETKRTPKTSLSPVRTLGGGDGLSQRKRRTPLLKLQKPDRHTKCLLRRSVSMAEFTPTKTVKRRKVAPVTMDDSYELYATPRPLMDKPAKLFCMRERATCTVQRRLMLMAWRRSRGREGAWLQLLKKKDEQINQLDLQVNVLNNLMTSEILKREQAEIASQKLSNCIETMGEDAEVLKNRLEELSILLEETDNDLKVKKAENNFLSETVMEKQCVIGQKQQEKIVLEDKVKSQDHEIHTLKTKITVIEEQLKQAQDNHKVSQVNYRIKERKYKQLQIGFKQQLSENTTLSAALEALTEDNHNSSLKIADLQSQLNDYIESCDTLNSINLNLGESMREIEQELAEERKHNWIKNTKRFALLSLKTIQKIANVVVPAYMDKPAYF